MQNTLSNILTNIRCSFCFGKQGGESTTFPVLWNLCLAARAEGLGTFITTLLKLRKQEVEQLLGMPEGFWHMHAMILSDTQRTMGHLPVKPANEFVYSEAWDNPVTWTGISNWAEPRTTDATTSKGKDGFRNT